MLLTRRKRPPVYDRGRMNVYLDIDGVLLRDGKPTRYCFEFLGWVTEFHTPFWLTTRDAHEQHCSRFQAEQ
jgi:ribonucleotide monophosphatase NagD (HAD superfamily)